MAKSAKTLSFGIGALMAALLATGTAGAQEQVPQCNGQDATIVFDAWTDGTVGFDGTESNDVIAIRPPANTTATVGNRNLIVRGNGGDDVICFSDVTSDMFGDVVLYGGGGNDTLFNIADSTFSQTTLIGGAGDDVLHGGAGADLLVGGTGNDQLFGYQGRDMLAGESGNDTIRGGSEFDVVAGGDGDDTIYGGPSNDLLYGGLGKDTIFGGTGHDLIASNDDFVGFHENEFELPNDQGPPGQFNLSTPSFSEDTAGSRMFGGHGRDLLIGSNRWDRMQGGTGNDILLGMEGRDWMRGGSGNDIIIGGSGIDNINGNLGFDSIILQGADIGHGGYGQDTCYTGLNGTSGSAFGQCERSGDANTQWPAILEQINDLYNSSEIAIVN